MKTFSLNPYTVRLLLTAFVGQAIAIGLARLALIEPLFAFGGLYAIAFCGLAWVRPDIALAVTLFVAPLQNDLSEGGAVGAKFSLIEVNLFLCGLMMVAKAVNERKRLSLGPLTVPVAAYFGIAIYSALQQWRGAAASRSLLQMFLYVVVATLLFAWFARKPEENVRALYALILSGLALAVVVLVTRKSYVLGLHKNGTGASLSYCLMICVALWFSTRDRTRQNLLLGALAIIAGGLIMTLSRGGWLSAIAGMLVITMLFRQWKIALWSTLALIPVIALVWSSLPQESRDYALDIDPKKRRNIAARQLNDQVALTLYHQNPIYGVGTGLRKQYDATNIALLTLAETGWIGLICFFGLQLVFFVMVWKTSRKLPPDDPLFVLLAVGAACMAGKLAHGMVDHYWTRGSAAIAYAGCGMALSVYFVVRSREQLAQQLLASEGLMRRQREHERQFGEQGARGQLPQPML